MISPTNRSSDTHSRVSVDSSRTYLLSRTLPSHTRIQQPSQGWSWIGLSFPEFQHIRIRVKVSLSVAIRFRVYFFEGSNIAYGSQSPLFRSRRLYNVEIESLSDPRSFSSNDASSFRDFRMVSGSWATNSSNDMRDSDTSAREYVSVVCAFCFARERCGSSHNSSSPSHGGCCDTDFGEENDIFLLVRARKSVVVVAEYYDRSTLLDAYMYHARKQSQAERQTLLSSSTLLVRHAAV